MSILIFLSFLFFCAVIYFIPTIVARVYSKKYFVGIFVVNFFLGWTFVGWVGALAWAVSSPSEKIKWN